MDVTKVVADMILPSLTDMGYELVRVQYTGNMTKTLQIMAERADRADMTVEDCAEISRTVSALLDVEDPIDGQYNLEVSSPGLDRPLTRKDDFMRFAGFEIKLETTMPVDGRKRYRGKLLGLTEDDEIAMTLDDTKEDVAINFQIFARAKLVLTDELLKQAQKAQDPQDQVDEEI